jgi:hypothetical protein
MVTDTARLRADVFEQTGIAIDEKDPIMAVLVASARQAEEIGHRVLTRVSPVRAMAVSAIAAAAAAMVASWTTWQIAQGQSRAERAEWALMQTNPRTSALLRSGQGRAAIRLADLGVARMLADCSGRASWRVVNGYCIPITAAGKPDGFKIIDRQGTK